MSTRLKWIMLSMGALVPVLVLAFFAFGLWTASGQILAPSFRGADGNLSDCKPETEQYWGPQCGNLRATHQFAFNEVRIPRQDGSSLPGWFIRTDENGLGEARGAIMLVHAGGSDRREDTRYISFYLSQHLDVLTFDLGCHGEAPCSVYGLSYGEREAQDVRAAYDYLAAIHRTVYAFGSSVGASSILVALPNLPDLAGVIAENPMYSFRRLIKEAPEAQAAPGWFSDLLIRVALWRGRFDGLMSPAAALPRARANVPILFIHSTEDRTVSYTQTQQLAELYGGPRIVWLPEHGSHAAVWDVNQTEYEARVASFLT